MGDIGDLLSERHALERSKNRKILLPILSNIRYLARQALPLLRGDWNSETMSKEKRDEKYTSLEIQNDLLEAMALGMTRQISANIQNTTFFTIMKQQMFLKRNN